MCAVLLCVTEYLHQVQQNRDKLHTEKLRDKEDIYKDSFCHIYNIINPDNNNIE